MARVRKNQEILPGMEDMVAPPKPAPVAPKKPGLLSRVSNWFNSVTPGYPLPAPRAPRDPEAEWAGTVYPDYKLNEKQFGKLYAASGETIPTGGIIKPRVTNRGFEAPAQTDRVTAREMASGGQPGAPGTQDSLFNVVYNVKPLDEDEFMKLSPRFNPYESSVSSNAGFKVTGVDSIVPNEDAIPLRQRLGEGGSVADWREAKNPKPRGIEPK